MSIPPETSPSKDKPHPQIAPVRGWKAQPAFKTNTSRTLDDGIEDHRRISPIPFRTQQEMRNYGSDIAANIEAAEQTRRDFSGRLLDSNLSESSVSEHAKVRKEKGLTQGEFEQEMRVRVEEQWAKKIAEVDEHINRLEGQLKIVNADYSASRLSTADYKVARPCLAAPICELRTIRQKLKAHRFRLTGEMMNQVVIEGHRENERFHLIDSLIDRLEVPWGATTSIKEKPRKNKQQEFATEVLEVYGAKSPANRRKPTAWCCICRHAVSHVRAAHIVPHSVGDTNANYLFGHPEHEDGTHVMSPRNALPMASTFERAFDKGQLIIVPAEPDDQDPEEAATGMRDRSIPTQIRLKVVVLDPALLTGANDSAEIPFDANAVMFDARYLDGRILGFRNEMRPLNRYLYFRFALTVATRRRHIVPGYQFDASKYATQTYWGTPGAYMKRSTLHAIMADIGHTTPANVFGDEHHLPVDGAPEPEPDDIDATDRYIARAVRQPAALEEEEEEEEEQY